MTDRDDRIRELAYFLWLEQGCPEGEAERHWLTAETLVDSEERKSIEGEPPGEPVRISPDTAQPSAPERDSDLTELTRSVPAPPKRSGQGHELGPAE